MHNLVAVVGPTASGKSELAIAVALRFQGEIINCDSLQVYRYLDIGTAKLKPSEMRGVPHHLIDIVDPDENFSAGDYMRLARAVLADITSRGRLPIVAGGTGFYLRALIHGLFPGPSRDENLRARLAAREARRAGFLHRLLQRIDPEVARRIHPNDRHKLIRAIEIAWLTRKPPSQAFASGRDRLEGYRPLILGLNPPRAELYARIDQRCLRMFQAGLIDEVRRILLLGFSPNVKPLEAHGYKQALQVLRGELPLEKAIYYAQRNTRRYAKRQWTWFRQEPGIEWIDGFGDDPAIQNKAFRRVEEFLSAPAEALAG